MQWKQLLKRLPPALQDATLSEKAEFILEGLEQGNLRWPTGG
jgi:hypothetical protein